MKSDGKVSPKLKHLLSIGYVSVSIIQAYFNRIVLGQLPYPFILTGVQSLFILIGCYVVLRYRSINGKKVPLLSKLKHGNISASPLNLLHYYTKTLSRDDLSLLLGYAILYSFSTYITYEASKHISSGTDLLVKSTVPFFVLALDDNYRDFPWQLYGSLAAGCIFTFFSVFPNPGLYYGTILGLVGAVLSAGVFALQLTATNKLISSRQFGSSIVELLYAVTPFVLLQSVLYSLFTGELTSRATTNNSMIWSPTQWIFPAVLVLNGLASWGTHLLAYNANKVAGPLGLSVAANCKHSLLHLFAIEFLGQSMSGYQTVFDLFMILIISAYNIYANLEGYQIPSMTPTLPYREE